MSFYIELPFLDGYNLRVNSQSPTNKEADIEVIGDLGNCKAVLIALWKTDMFGQIASNSPHPFGDYFQQTIVADPIRLGLGPRLHDALILIKDQLPFTLINLYSTNEDEDGFHLNDFGKHFWEKRVEQGKAEFVETLGRFRIIW